MIFLYFGSFLSFILEHRKCRDADVHFLFPSKINGLIKILFMTDLYFMLTCDDICGTYLITKLFEDFPK